MGLMYDIHEIFNHVLLDEPLNNNLTLSWLIIARHFTVKESHASKFVHQFLNLSGIVIWLLLSDKRS